MFKLPCNERANAEEWVDDPQLSREDIRDTLCDLAVINRVIGGARATLAHGFPLLQSCVSDPIRVLDAGCGGADLSRCLVDRARRLNKGIEIVGLDLSQKVIACAREFSAGYPEITFVCADALHPPFQQGAFDLVILTTFIHHLQPAQIVDLLRVAREICRGQVIVADLVRSPLAYLEFWLFARMMRFSPVSIHDGLLSVRRAYTPVELADLARQAGLAQWKLYRHLFYRMTLVYAGESNRPIKDAGQGGSEHIQ